MWKFYCVLIILNLDSLFVSGKSLETIEKIKDLENRNADSIANLLNPHDERSPVKIRVARDAPPSWMVQPPNQQNFENQHSHWVNQNGVPSWMRQRTQAPVQNQPIPHQNPSNQRPNVNQQLPIQNQPILQQNPSNQLPNFNQQTQPPTPAPIFQNTQRPWQNQPQWNQNQNQQQVNQWSPEIVISTQNPWIQTEKPRPTYPPVFVPDQVNHVTNQPVTDQIIQKTPPAWIPQPEKPSVIDVEPESSQAPQIQTTWSIITAPVIRRTVANSNILSSIAPDVNVNPWNRLPIIQNTPIQPEITQAPWNGQQTQGIQPIDSIVTNPPFITAPVIRKPSVNQAVQGPEIASILPIIQGNTMPSITAPAIRPTQSPSINRQTELPSWINTHFTAPVITKGTTRQIPLFPVTAPRVTTSTTARQTVRPLPTTFWPGLMTTRQPVTISTTRQPITPSRLPLTTTRQQVTTARPIVTPAIPIFNPGGLPQGTTVSTRPTVTNRPLTTSTRQQPLTTSTRQQPLTGTARPLTTSTRQQPLTGTARPLTTQRPIITRTTSTSTQRPIITRTTSPQRQTTASAMPTRDFSRTTQAIKEQQPQRNQQSLNDIMKMTENIFSTLNNHLLQSIGQFGRK